MAQENTPGFLMQIRRALKLGLTNSQIIPALVEVQNNGAQADYYREKLNSLRNRGAIERLCELAMFENEKYPLARQIALVRNYLPKAKDKTALFYYFTEQWDKYEALDYSYKFKISELFRTLPPETQRKAASLGRKVGRSDLVQQLMAQKVEHVPGAEQLTLDSLAEQERWGELYQLLTEWSPIWSRQILQKLAHANWQPANETDQNNLKNLLAIAQNLSPEAAFGKYRHKRNYSFAPVSEKPRIYPEATISRQGVIVAMPDFTPQISLYDINTGELVDEIPWPTTTGYYFTPFKFLFSPDGLYVALLSSASLDLTVCIFDVARKTAISNFSLEPDFGGRVAFFPDNRLLIYKKNSAGQKSVYQIYDIFSEKLLESLDGPPALDISEITLSPNGMFLAGRDDWKTLWVWSIPEKQLIVSLPNQTSYYIGMKFSPDSLRLALVAPEDVRVLDIETGKIILQLPIKDIQGVYIGFSPDKQIFVTGQQSTAEINFWRIADGTLVDSIQLEDARLLDIFFNFQGDSICLLTENRHLHIWQEEFRDALQKPLKENRLADLAWLEERLQSADLAADVRHWLEFSVALLKWRWRHEVMLEESGNKAANPTDIELED